MIKVLHFRTTWWTNNKVSRKLGDTLKIVGEKSATNLTGTTSINTAADNITVKKNSEDTLEIGLSKN